ncbi:MAG: hypothetical protein LBB24_03660 [Rickettsiales bacterium]|jgi:hypothetical protein|nr:hypothetical protein [Rickettsiales bacterium]
MWVQKIKEYLGNLIGFVSAILNDLRVKWFNLYRNNISQAVDYFSLGMLYECHSRLKIILKMWPNDEHAKYLLGLFYVCVGEEQNAVKYLGQVNGFKRDQAQKLLSLIEAGKSGVVVEKYLENPSLEAVEGEIEKVTL